MHQIDVTKEVLPDGSVVVTHVRTEDGQRQEKIVHTTYPTPKNAEAAPVMEQAFADGAKLVGAKPNGGGGLTWTAKDDDEFVEVAGKLHAHAHAHNQKRNAHHKAQAAGKGGGKK